MAIDAGTYLVVSAKDIKKALDVANHVDAKGANVQIYNRNGTSGQFVTVTGSGTRQVLRFPLTGKVLDVYDAKAKNGQNIIQWVGNNGNGQAWNIVSAGTSSTIEGETFDHYFIKTALNNSYVVGLKGNATANGTNVQLATLSSSNLAHKWCFLPVKLLPSGYYRFVSALDQRVCLSASNSKDGSNVQVAGISLDDDSQIWAVSAGGTTTNIKNAQSHCYLNAAGVSAGSDVTQKASTNGGYTSWLLTTNGTEKYNGATYPLVFIRCSAGDNESVVDVGGGNNKLTTNVKLYKKANRLCQMFIAMPSAPLNKSIAAPSSPLMAYSEGATAYRAIWGIGKTVAYPNWISNYTQFQFRYRYRYRKATWGDGEHSAWSAWRSNGSTANDGWGNVGSANIKTKKLADPSGQRRCYGQPIAITLSATGNDLVEYQYQVRAVSNKKRGYITTASGKFAYRPTLEMRAITWTPKGLNLVYRSDQKRNNNDMVIYSVTCVHGGKTYTVYDGGSKGFPVNDIPWSGAATIPQSKIKYIPALNDSVTVKLRFTNVDGAYKSSKQTFTENLSYGAGYGLVIRPTLEITDGKMLHVKCMVENGSGTLVSPDKFTVWIDYGDDRKGYVAYKDDDGEFYIPILFNRSYRVHILAELGTKWDAYSQLMPAVSDEYCYWFNYVNASTEEQDWVRIKYNEGGAPRVTRGVAPSNSINLTNGNTFEVVHYGYGRSETIEVEGVIPRTWSLSHSMDNKFDQLNIAHYAWFRGEAFGGRYNAFRVAVTNVDFDYSNPEYISVRVSARRIANPVDW